jgi:hypothetical protein
MSAERAPLSQDIVGVVMVKMSLTYGKRFTNAYDASPESVSAHWAQELAGVSPAGVLYALERLPADYVPNVLQFRAIASNRPQEARNALPAPEASPSVRREHLGSLEGLRDGFALNKGRDPLAWAERILASPHGKCMYAVKLATEALRGRGRIQ